MSPQELTAAVDPLRVQALADRERRWLEHATQASHSAYQRASTVLAGGAPSSFQMHEPWPIYLTHGSGPTVWDADGSRRVDFHCGFGAMVQGHAHPAISRAVEERVERGTHLAAPTEDAVVVARELARRFGLQKWRFANSGTEATLDAIRIARGVTGRYVVVLIFDEVKTGLSIAAGGAVERFGVRPDIVTLAKALGGGLPSGAIGSTDEIMGALERRSVFQAGTFNGNALTMAAA